MRLEGSKEGKREKGKGLAGYDEGEGKSKRKRKVGLKACGSTTKWRRPEDEEDVKVDDYEGEPLWISVPLSLVKHSQQRNGRVGLGK